MGPSLAVNAAVDLQEVRIKRQDLPQPTAGTCRPQLANELRRQCGSAGLRLRREKSNAPGPFADCGAACEPSETGLTMQYRPSKVQAHRVLVLGVAAGLLEARTNQQSHAREGVAGCRRRLGNEQRTQCGSIGLQSRQEEGNWTSKLR